MAGELKERASGEFREKETGEFSEKKEQRANDKQRVGDEGLACGRNVRLLVRVITGPDQRP